MILYIYFYIFIIWWIDFLLETRDTNQFQLISILLLEIILKVTEIVISFIAETYLARL